MMASRFDYQIMQLLEIVMIAGKQNTLIANCMCEMDGVIFSGQFRISRDLDVVTSLTKKPCK